MKCRNCEKNEITLNTELYSIYGSLCLDCYIDAIPLNPRERCLLLDYTARADLRQINEKGYINRTHYKKRGVILLMLLGLIKRTRETKTMYRYEATETGLKASKFLPDFESEWNCTMGKEPLVYGDGTIVKYGDEPHYSKIEDYHKLTSQYTRRK